MWNMPYQIVIADPPWNFLTYSERGRGKSPKYPVMSMDELKDIPICTIMDKNAALFLWVTWPMIEEAFDVMRMWGFTYRTLAFDWYKTTKHGKPAFGTGYYFRAGPEACLLGVRGVMPVAVRNERNVIVAPAREHSRKPDEQYSKIERVYPTSLYPNRLELFASEYSAPVAIVNGYDVIGYDVQGQDIRTVIGGMIDAEQKNAMDATARFRRTMRYINP